MTIAGRSRAIFGSVPKDRLAVAKTYATDTWVREKRRTGKAHI